MKRTVTKKLCRYAFHFPCNCPTETVTYDDDEERSLLEAVVTASSKWIDDKCSEHAHEIRESLDRLKSHREKRE